MTEKESTKPRFSIRGINVCESLARHTPEQVTHLIERMVKWNMNTLVLHRCYGYKFHRKLIETLCQQAGIEITYYVQTALAFTPRANSRLFALDVNLKPHTKQACNETRLCVSNPESREYFRGGARKYFISNDVLPESKHLLMDADGYLFCECEKCQKIKPVNQWTILLEIAVEEADKADKNLNVEYLSYVWRYSIPEKFDIFQKISGVLFDTHQRFRWRALNEPNPPYLFSELEAKADERANELPLNQYLHERLMEWRQKFSGRLYVFENLMIQGSISCPQPNTNHLLKDLEIYEDLGLQGVIYEVFEPGIQSFEKQLDIISKALFEKPQTYFPTQLEIITQKLTGDEFIDYNPAVGYLALEEEEIISSIKADGFDNLLSRYIILLRSFLLNRTCENCYDILDYVLENRNRFDWMMITFNLIRLVPKEQLPKILDEELLLFIKANKLWDLQEKMQSPVIETHEIIKRLVKLM